MKRERLQQLLADTQAKHAVALVSRIESGQQWLVYPDAVAGDEALDSESLTTARQALTDDRSGLHETEAGQIFVQIFNPPLRMIVVGAVHIAQALAPMAQQAGYEVIIIDPRQAWTTDTRFPNVSIRGDWPDTAMTALAPDRRTAVITLSHDPKLDDPALHVALRSEAFYIGCLGSRKTNAARLQRLHEAGFSEAETSRIHGPIGLNIGARSPAEIAIAILAEVTQTLHKPA